MNLKNIFNILPQIINKSEFNRNVSILFLGQIITQVIAFLASFIITRLYTVDQIGVYALFIASTTILTIISTGSYDAAIIVEDEDEKINSLWVLSILISFLSNIFLLILLIFFSENILSILNFNGIQAYVLLIPPTVFIGSIIRATQFYFNKYCYYNDIKNSDIIKSSLNSGGSIILGFLKFLNAGLIISNIFAVIISASFLLYKLPATFLEKLKSLVTIDNLKKTAFKYKNYLTYYSLSSLLNAIVSNGTPILIIFFFTNKIAGYYFLAEKVISIPISLIVVSISKVFYQNANNLYNTNKTQFLNLIYNIQKKMAQFLLPFLLVLSILSPYFFKLFGNGWEFSGEMVKYFIILVFFKNLVSPVGAISNIINRLDLLLYFNISIALLRIITFYLGSKYLSFEYSLLFSSVMVSLCYITLDIILKRIIKNEMK